MPNFVQIYAAPAGGGIGSAQLVADVDVKSSQTDYDQVITLYAGVYYAIYVCPRTGSKTAPNDLNDGQYWEGFCQMKYITTQKPSTPPVTLPPPSAPQLTPQPANLTNGNRIVVSWASSYNYDKYVVGWTQDGIEMQPQDIKQGGTTGSWEAPTTPGHNYTFHVNGGVSQFWNYNYSDWGPTSSATAVPNVTSLREFLTISGINPAGKSLRSLVQAGQTLRSYMKL